MLDRQEDESAEEVEAPSRRARLEKRLTLRKRESAKGTLFKEVLFYIEHEQKHRLARGRDLILSEGGLIIEKKEPPHDLKFYFLQADCRESGALATRFG